MKRMEVEGRTEKWKKVKNRSDRGEWEWKYSLSTIPSAYGEEVVLVGIQKLNFQLGRNSLERGNVLSLQWHAFDIVERPKTRVIFVEYELLKPVVGLPIV